MRKFWSDWGNEVFSYKFFNLSNYRIAIGFPLQREIGIEIFSRKFSRRFSKKFSKKFQSKEIEFGGKPIPSFSFGFFYGFRGTQSKLGNPIQTGEPSQNPSQSWNLGEPNPNPLKNFESLGQSATRKKESRAIYPFNICRLGFFLFADDSCYPR